MSEVEDTTAGKPKGSVLSRVLLIVGILLVLTALGIGAYLGWQYLNSQNHNAAVRSVSGLDIDTVERVQASDKLEDLVFDWDALRAINPEVIGWIIIPGTNVNYPVVQGTDNYYYLTHLFDKDSAHTGAVFADYEGSRTLDAPNNIIYAHNVFDGTMFSDLVKFDSQDFFNEHQTVYLCTPEKNMELAAVASIHIRYDAPLRQFAFEGPTAYTTFVKETLAAPEASVEDLSARIAKCKQLYSLVTCQNLDGAIRVTLCCMPVREVAPKNS